jgi:hypothetical protein
VYSSLVHLGVSQLLVLDPCTSKTMHALVCSGIQDNRRILCDINQRSCPSLFSGCGKPDDSAVKGLHQTVPFYIPSPSHPVEKSTQFLYGSLFFVLKTAGFSAFSHVFFPPRQEPTRIMCTGEYRNYRRIRFFGNRLTVFLNRKFGVF